jgi:hypothetical protein
MDKIDIVSLSFNRIDKTKITKKGIVKEFESFLLEEFLKEAFKPILEGKSFTQKMYWDTFLTTLSEKITDEDPLKFQKMFSAYFGKGQKG